MSKQRDTIKKQIAIMVIGPVVLALMVIAGFNYANTSRLLKESSERLTENIVEEIKRNLQFQDYALSLIERNLDFEIQELSEELLNNTEIDFSDVDLNALLIELELDTNQWDLYVINRNGKVVNTSFAPDLGLEFFEFGKTFENFLKQVYYSGQLVIERLATEKNTNKKRKYAYQVTADRKYILQIGVYSDEASELIQSTIKGLNNFSNEHKNIESVELFIGYENPIAYNSKSILSKDKLLTYQKAIDENEKQKLQSQDDNIELDFVPIKREGTDLYNGAAVKVAINNSAQKEQIKSELLFLLAILAVLTVVLLLIIYRSAKYITEPISGLLAKVKLITKGDLQQRAVVFGNNEITTLSEHFNLMVSELEESYHGLELKVAERTKEISKQKAEIEFQNTRIEESINYARRIQNAIIPDDTLLKRFLTDHFMLYKPKDVVSGDFPWIFKIDKMVYVAAIDCTGHGVPGAMMSLIGYLLLNDIIKDNSDGQSPGDILERLHNAVVSTLKQAENEDSIADGMDIALCRIDTKNNELSFAGAHRPLYHLSGGEFTEYKGSRFPIGGIQYKSDNKYETHSINIKINDKIFIFSDGYPDQFGGPENRKFGTKRMKEIIIENKDASLEEFSNIFGDEFSNWKGSEKQIDDVLLLGIKF